jgi:hypothetical protein
MFIFPFSLQLIHTELIYKILCWFGLLQYTELILNQLEIIEF